MEKNIKFYIPILEDIVKGLDNEQIGQALMMLVEFNKNGKAPFTEDKKTFAAFKKMQASSDYCLKQDRKNYVEAKNNVTNMEQVEVSQ